MIRIIGLGNRAGDITLNGLKAVKNCRLAVVRTALTPTYADIAELGIDTVALDGIYEGSEDFDDLNERLVSEVLSYEKEYGDICYCVNGSGCDDRSAITLAERTETEIVPSVGKDSRVMSTAKQVYSAYDVVGIAAFMPDGRFPLSVYEIDNRYVASELKLMLCDIYGDETAAILTNGGEEKKIRLCELDMEKKYSYDTSLLVPPAEMFARSRYTFIDLLTIMYRLRDKEKGCEWDKAQTHKSILGNIIEEAYELVEAINNEDMTNMAEETGDLLLQAVFHALIGEEAGEYTCNDAISMLCEKLLKRHTHIFGDVVANTPEEALKAWEEAKAAEKGVKKQSDKFDAIPKTIPQTERAYRAVEIAFKMGLLYSGNGMQKVNPLSESKAADEKLVEIGGELLFVALNFVTCLEIDPEILIKGKTEEFIERVRYIEARAEKLGKTVDRLSAKQIGKLWEESKTKCR